MLSALGEWQAGKWWWAGALLQVPAAVLASVLIVFSKLFIHLEEVKRIQPCVIKVIFPESIWLSQEFNTLTRKYWSWSWQAPRTGNIKPKSFWAFVHGDAVGTDGRKGRMSQAEDPVIPAGEAQVVMLEGFLPHPPRPLRILAGLCLWDPDKTSWPTRCTPYASISLAVTASVCLACLPHSPGPLWSVKRRADI